MIKNIILKNAGTFDDTGSSLDELKALNFIFGSNGSGKTTISRIINHPDNSTDSKITWASGKALETRIYNKDFVKEHFDAESNIKGIYTFGENIEAAKEIERLKAEAGGIDKKLNVFKTTLNGEDDKSRKKKEKNDIKVRNVEDIWQAKVKIDDLKDAFTGLNTSKDKFYTRYLLESEKNTAELRDIGELREDAATVFYKKLSEVALLPEQNKTKLASLETSDILTKKIIGKKDVDIAALIEKLGNSDWVQQGQQYFEQLVDQCPFCQQETNEIFRQNLEDYFDEKFAADLDAVNDLLEKYEAQANSLLDAYQLPAVIDSTFLDRDAFENDIAHLKTAINANIGHIKAKQKEPSASVTLKDTEPLIASINAHISKANTAIKKNNETFQNLDDRKIMLKDQIWKRLLEDTKETYTRFQKDSNAIEKAIKSLNDKIDNCTKDLKQIQNKIEENERKITSIKPTIDEINNILKSFGFTNFELTESSDKGFYMVKRPNGSDAKDTLSEGEKSFITFLYFYHLIGGSFSASGSTDDKVVVFDDPVSSLDADILFIVCQLIKGIVSTIGKKGSAIKQIFVLTHNIYFHKEITFNKKRNGTAALNGETFWIIRKSSERSELIPFLENPIKSSYELLWQQVRQKPHSDTAVQNALRRILEHYFKFLGGLIFEEDIIEKFDGQDKIVCGSLITWVNDGSHFTNDDLFVANPGQIDRYLTVFQRIFEESGHGGHYKMMMGDAYVELPVNMQKTAEPLPAAGGLPKKRSGNAPSEKGENEQRDL